MYFEENMLCQLNAIIDHYKEDTAHDTKLYT